MDIDLKMQILKNFHLLICMNLLDFASAEDDFTLIKNEFDRFDGLKNYEKEMKTFFDHLPYIYEGKPEQNMAKTEEIFVSLFRMDVFFEVMSFHVRAINQFWFEALSAEVKSGLQTLFATGINENSLDLFFKQDYESILIEMREINETPSIEFDGNLKYFDKFHISTLFDSIQRLVNFVNESFQLQVLFENVVVASNRPQNAIPKLKKIINDLKTRSIMFFCMIEEIFFTISSFSNLPIIYSKNYLKKHKEIHIDLEFSIYQEMCTTLVLSENWLAVFRYFMSQIDISHQKVFFHIGDAQMELFKERSDEGNVQESERSNKNAFEFSITNDFCNIKVAYLIFCLEKSFLLNVFMSDLEVESRVGLYAKNLYFALFSILRGKNNDSTSDQQISVNNMQDGVYDKDGIGLSFSIPVLKNLRRIRQNLHLNHIQTQIRVDTGTIQFGEMNEFTFPTIFNNKEYIFICKSFYYHQTTATVEPVEFSPPDDSGFEIREVFLPSHRLEFEFYDDFRVDFYGSFVFERKKDENTNNLPSKIKWCANFFQFELCDAKLQYIPQNIFFLCVKDSVFSPAIVLDDAKVPLILNLSVFQLFGSHLPQEMIFFGDLDELKIENCTISDKLIIRGLDIRLKINITNVRGHIQHEDLILNSKEFIEKIQQKVENCAEMLFVLNIFGIGIRKYELNVLSNEILGCVLSGKYSCQKIQKHTFNWCYFDNLNVSLPNMFSELKVTNSCGFLSLNLQDKLIKMRIEINSKLFFYNFGDEYILEYENVDLSEEQMTLLSSKKIKIVAVE